jgi:hypothetical protein
VPPARISILAALAALGVSCHSGPPPAIDHALAASVPAGATILAGVNLDRVRASPLHLQLPPAILAFLESISGARSVLAASDGTNYLVLTRGDFRQAPSGTTLLGQGLAAVGSSDWLRAAASQHGRSGPNGLLARAEPIAAAADIWMAAAGSANLPVSGNGENLNRLLHQTEFTTLTIRLTDNVTIDATGMCRGPEAALHLEETVRAIVTLGAAGTARQPALSGLLRRIRVTRDGRVVHLTLEAQAAELQTVFRLLAIGS